MARKPKLPSNVIPLFPKKKSGKRKDASGPISKALYEAEKRAQCAGSKAIDAYSKTGSSFYAIRMSLDAAKAYAEVADLFETQHRTKRAKLLRATSRGFLAEAKFYFAQLQRQGRDADRRRPA